MWYAESRELTFTHMETTTKEIKIRQAQKEVQKIVERYGLVWNDVLYLSWKRDEQRERKAQDEVLERLRGMWKHKKVDPIKYQKKIRKELERKLPRL